MTTHSLPSFAQTFSNQPPLGSISSGSNSLPPIQAPSLSRRAKSPRSRHGTEEDRVAGRKRSRTESASGARDDEPSDSDRDSPRLIRIKEEQEQDMLADSPPPQQRMILDHTGAPPPSSTQPSAAKKRRTTVSGPPALNTDVRSSADQLSPVVSVGFNLDNPSAIEQVRSMITVKQKQKALIEQRRGSVVSSPSISAGPTPAALLEERVAPAKPAASGRQRRSPNAGRRAANNGAQGRPPSPPAPVVQPVAGQNSLPPPPISFARRRAEQLGGKRKPADIIISPREAHTQEQFQPAIQSAPPIPQGGSQGSFYSGRFPMTLPRLPSVMGGGDTARRVPGLVPPTPTRLSMQRNSSANAAPTLAHPAPGAARSPPAASVAIASTLVPPTPMSLHHPGYSGDKSAFLAPFEVFYDALNDSKQLKNWLGEQLQRSNTLIQNLTQQQEKLNETVEGMVERKLAPMRAEISGLYRRVDELEDALRLATGRRQSVDSGSLKAKGKQPLRNGNNSLLASESYTFPPRPQQQQQQPDRTRGEPSRRASPGWPQPHDRDRDTQSTLESENGSPAPFDARRLSLSATRLDPPRPAFEARGSLQNVHSPPQGFRDQHSSPSAHHTKIMNHPAERPALPRTSSHSDRERERSSPQQDSRRNSVAIPSPDAPDDSAMT
ncbi:hypothetical protein B0H14DRAFT_2507370 [Mycena olivaceomarginata]|nr:hypothetical protein B0H14DRAFT_2507370 [Mycena olivaceomarginata]